MKNAPLLCLRATAAWGQVCTLPTSTFNPAIIPPGETQHLVYRLGRIFLKWIDYLMARSSEGTLTMQRGRQIKVITMIVAFVALAMSAWGQTCLGPTPIFAPPTMPAGETQPLELNGFVRTALPVSSFAMVSNIYNASGYPWLDCRGQVFTRITDTDTFLSISPHSGGDYFVYETGLTAKGAPTLVNRWSMNGANKQAPITSQAPLLDWNHEAIRLPDGWTAVVAHEEMMVTSATQCPTAQFPNNYCDVMGAKIVVMDSAGTVQWVWDSFNETLFPYINRRAVLGETCMPAPNECPVTLAPVAQDWLHANSLWYDPVDGNLVVSLRNQDWIVKLAYQNGAGNGAVVWRLGNQGDFSMKVTTVPSPWNDHQHDVTSPACGVYSMFDNGNGRHAANGGQSRGLVYVIDEAKLEVVGIQVYPLHLFSPGNGSAQLLTNGNWMFMAGYPYDKATGEVYSAEFEFAPNATTPLWVEELPQQYRTTRLSGLFHY